MIGGTGNSLAIKHQVYLEALRTAEGLLFRHGSACNRGAPFTTGAELKVLDRGALIARPRYKYLLMAQRQLGPQF